MSNEAEFKKMQALIDRTIDKAFSKKNMQLMADEMADRVRRRTRLGKGVDKSGGNPKNLRPLTSAVYKKKRENSKELNRQKTKPKKSNLTFTGQLLDSIIGESKKAQEFILKIKNGRKNDKVTNSEIVDYQEGQGRAFFHFSKPEISGIYRKLKEILKKELKL